VCSLDDGAVAFLAVAQSLLGKLAIGNILRQPDP